jgi:hypothetical protein
LIPNASNGPTWASGSCRSRVKHTMTASWMPGSGSACTRKESGHLCCCQVPPAAGCKTMPIWKLGLDVFFDAKSKLHTGAALLYKGGSRFCLVECQRSKDYKFNPRLRLLKMASFVLKYDWEAELRTAHHRDHASMSYQVGHDCGYALLNPVAFWM